MSFREPLNICIIAGAIEAADATSQVVLANMEAIAAEHSRDLPIDVRLYCRSSSVIDSRIFVVPSLLTLASDEFFQTADLVIHHFGIESELHLALGIVNRAARIVVEFHGVTPPQYLPSELEPAIHRSYQQIALFEHADEIIVHTDHLREELRRAGVSRSIRKIELFGSNVGGASDNMDAADRDRRGVIYCGRFIHSKQVLELIDALVAISNSLERVDATFIGPLEYSDGGYLADVRERIASLPENVEIRLRTDLAANEVAAAIANADLLVLPSLHEGFGMPVAEALAAGTPVLCSDGGALPEVAGGHAALFRAGDAVSLADTLLNALNARSEGAVLTSTGPIDYPIWRQGAVTYASRFRRTAFIDRWRSYARILLADIHAKTPLRKMVRMAWAAVLSSNTNHTAMLAPVDTQLMGGLLARKAEARVHTDPPSAVAILHHAAFDRTADDTDVNYWLHQLNVGGVRGVLTEMLRSDEIRDEPDRLRTLSAAKASARSTDAAAFTTSPASFTRDELLELLAALDNKNMVVMLYELLLGREPDEQGAVAHRLFLDAGGSRGDLILSFLASEEHRARQKVGTLYNRLS